MVGGAVAPLLITNASTDPRFSDHPGLHQYGIESYIAVPLNRRDGTYFGTLCALDPRPAELSEDDFAILNLLAQLIAFELEAEDQRQQREADVQALEDFIAIAAHDLRQPLAALYGRAQLLARRARPGGAAEDLIPGIETLVVQTRRAIQLTEKLLDVARVEMGDFALEREELDFAALAQQAVEDAQLNAPNHTFVFDAPLRLPFYGDANRLGQVLRNLLDNAVKYTPPENGVITCTVRRVEDQIQLVVRDAGIGVTDQDLPRLFGRMYRASNAKSANIGGIGLGLFITAQIIAAHGGRIWAEHGAPHGLVVQIELPANPAQQ